MRCRARTIAMLLVIVACTLAPPRGAAVFGADAATKPAATQPWYLVDPPAVEVTRSIAPTRVIEVPQNTMLLGVAPDGSYAATARYDYRWHVWRFALHVWPELLVWLGIGLWLVLVYRAWKRRVRGWWRSASQTTGEPHCARCDYQLTGVTSPTCPECGAPLAGKGTRRRGDGAWPHLRPWAILALYAALLAGSAATMRWFTPFLEHRPGWEIAKDWFPWASVPHNYNLVREFAFDLCLGEHGPGYLVTPVMKADLGDCYFVKQDLVGDGRLEAHHGGRTWGQYAYFPEDPLWNEKHQIVYFIDEEHSQITALSAVSKSTTSYQNLPTETTKYGDKRLVGMVLDKSAGRLWADAVGRISTTRYTSLDDAKSEIETASFMRYLDDGVYATEIRGYRGLCLGPIGSDALLKLPEVGKEYGGELSMPWMVTVGDWSYLQVRGRFLRALRVPDDLANPLEPLVWRKIAFLGYEERWLNNHGLVFIVDYKGNQRGPVAIRMFDLESWAWLPTELSLAMPTPGQPGTLTLEPSNYHVDGEAIVVNHDNTCVVVRCEDANTGRAYFLYFDLRDVALPGRTPARAVTKPAHE